MQSFASMFHSRFLVEWNEFIDEVEYYVVKQSPGGRSALQGAVPRYFRRMFFWNSIKRKCLFSTTKLRKKLVKAKRFGKINAIRPEIKAKRGRTGKFNLGQIANWGGLVKELGCQIVTQKQGSDAGFSTKQIGAEWRTFHRLFTTRFLFRKLLHFA